MFLRIPLYPYWTELYICLPDVLVYSVDKNLICGAFKSIANILDIKIKSILGEAAHSVFILNHTHAPSQWAFKTIKAELLDLDKEDTLGLALKAANDSVGPDGFVPTLLLFGVLLCLGKTIIRATPLTFRAALVMQKVTESISDHLAMRQVRDAMSARDGPNATGIHDTPMGRRFLPSDHRRICRIVSYYFRPWMEKTQLSYCLRDLALPSSEPHS